jgi:hypothetical protein
MVRKLSLMEDNIISPAIFCRTLREWTTLCIFSPMETSL